MFRYQVPYRYYTIAKFGFGAAYLWYVFDLFRIHSAIWHNAAFPISAPDNLIFSGNVFLDAYLRPAAVALSGQTAVWILFIMSPFVVGLYLWGRHRLLQMAIGGWISLSMILLNSLVGVFNSTADIWVNLVFLAYGLSAMVQANGGWKTCESGFSLAQWRANPVLSSTFAWLVVLIQFCVYFFAGINKLVYGWTPWIHGLALQNLAYDSSMRAFVRDISVPPLLAFLLGYLTLFQRLIVPFGFFLRRYRIWTVIILGSMHIGYAILMYVNLFPVIGLSCLAMVMPPVFSNVSHKKIHGRKKSQDAVSYRMQPAGRISRGVLVIFSAWMLLEPLRLIKFPATPWENKLMIVPAWRMFADGGATAGEEWRLILDTPQGPIDGTKIALGLLPQVWRDRFYIDDILHEILIGNTGPGTLPEKLAAATEHAYASSQSLSNNAPTVLGSSFNIYRRKPVFEAGKSL
ncbi:MAG TPA: HTTM domain-containing protein [Verrucomicrobiae bacterium]|jgi:hypothetical protein|nr:HTTM domain-containing protein [Verrucomicrobiae bacterium]